MDVQSTCVDAGWWTAWNKLRYIEEVVVVDAIPWIKLNWSLEPQRFQKTQMCVSAGGVEMKAAFTRGL